MHKTILIVEDEYQIREDIVTLFEINNFRVLSAGNGRIALDIIENDLPDIIISDVMMPEMNGFEFLKEIQKKPVLASIPFLFLTAKTYKNDLREGMNLGADDYITKPFDFNELLSAVNIRLKKRERSEHKYQKKLDDLRRNLRRSLPHEIRTPLNSIIGFSDILIKTLERTSIEDALEMLNHINDAGKRLNTLFEKYLLYANLEILMSSREEIESLNEQYVSSASVVIKEHAQSIMRRFGRLDDLELDLKNADISISEVYLLKIIEELLENCCKFSELGTPITIRSRAYSKMYEISFTDTGRGMSEEQINSYEPYIQFERKVYEQQGSGLGLAIVKGIIKIFNGKLVINSIPGVETVVSVKLPIYEQGY